MAEKLPQGDDARSGLSPWQIAALMGAAAGAWLVAELIARGLQ